MSNFVNIRISEDRLIDPELQLLVDRIALNNPRWVFSQNKKVDGHHFQITRTYSQSAEVQESKTAPEGFKYLRMLEVHQDGELLGRVGVDNNYRRSSDKHWHYTITSWRVDKSRGSKNTMTTTKLDIAVRTAKKVFSPMNMREIMQAGEDSIQRGFYDASRNLRDPIQGSRLIKCTVTLQAFALAKALGEPIVSPDLLAIEQSLTSDKYQQAMGEYFLAHSMSDDVAHRKLITIIAVGGNQYIMRNDEGDVTRFDFDQLSDKVQSNVSVLQLMQDNEVVRDVGYRYNDTHFMVYV